ncbi:glycine--tRNA ligase subunit beta [Neisseriaceae bacterium CLB008]
MQDTLLIELRTEELPPKALEKLGASFAQSLQEELVKAQLIDADAACHAFASPRRLAVMINDVKDMQADQQVLRKGPSTKAAMKDGQPTPALLGFARSCGAEVADLHIVNDGKQDVYAYEFLQAGQPLAALISDMIQVAVKKLPIPKVMRWGSSTHQFVRPVHGLVIMHGSQLVPGSVLGLDSQNWTLGHRFLSTEPVVFAQAQDYARQMHEEGKVIASFEARRALINQHLNSAAAGLNASIAADADLLNEVTALVEWPVVLEAGFDAEFLAVPQECLILTMQQNQKYFPLLNTEGKLINRFLLVSNLEAKDPSHIIQGNERVLRARLSDAAFFFEQDQKQPLESRLPKLANVVYHNKLGSQLERIERIKTLAVAIAGQLGADVAKTERAAALAKADLVTGMVGEFPELQGTMGKYYAQHDQEDAVVAAAIEQHYQPRFAGDALPQSKEATAVALADKLEALVGIWGIGLIPTGDKDPYALRRSALGILRMLLGSPLNLKSLIQAAQDSLKGYTLSADTAEKVYEFMLARLGHLLEHDYSQDVIAAVLSKQPEVLDTLIAKLQAVTEFKTLAEAAALASANKRVQNLLKKTDGDLGSVDVALLSLPAEQALQQAMDQVLPQVQAHLNDHAYTQALSALTSLKAPVDGFFEDVMVMDPDPALKQNRLNLLNQLAQALNAVANIAQLDAAH